MSRRRRPGRPRDDPVPIVNTKGSKLYALNTVLLGKFNTPVMPNES